MATILDRSLKVMDGISHNDVTDSVIASTRALKREVTYQACSMSQINAGDTFTLDYVNSDRTRNVVYTDFSLKYKWHNTPSTGSGSFYPHLAGIFGICDRLTIKVNDQLVFQSDTRNLKLYHLIKGLSKGSMTRYFNSITGTVARSTMSSLTDTATVASGADSGYIRTSFDEIFWGFLRNMIGASFRKLTIEMRLAPVDSNVNDSRLIGFAASTSMANVQVRELALVITKVVYPDNLVLSTVRDWTYLHPRYESKSYSVTPNSATQTIVVKFGGTSTDFVNASLVNRIFVYGTSSAITTTYSLTTQCTAYVSTLITDIVLKVSGQQVAEWHGSEVASHMYDWFNQRGIDLLDSAQTNAGYTSYIPSQFFHWNHDSNTYHDMGYHRTLAGIIHQPGAPLVEITFTLGGLAAASADIDTAVVVVESTRMIQLFDASGDTVAAPREYS